MTCEAGNPGPRWLKALAPARTARKLAFQTANLPLPLTLALSLALTLGGCISDPFLGPPQDTAADSSAGSPAAPDPEPAATPSDAAAGPDTAAAQEISMVPTQVLQLAPEAFSSEEWALWDGQRTMAGRWVALPDIAYSTRVRITHAETGASTDGALILRDPGRAGPRLIVSSDAAQALGLRPGVAAAVELVALRFGEIPEPPASESPVEGLAIAGGADGAEGAPGAQQGPTPLARPAERTAARAVPQAATVQQPPSGTPDPTPAPTPAPEPGPEPGPAPSPEPTLALPPAAPATGQPTVAPAASPKAVTPEAATPETAAPKPSAPEETNTAAEGAITDGLPYIQAGIFGDPTNATRLIGQLQAAGLPAHAVVMQRGTRHLTRVLVGPFDSDDARDQALSTVRRIGPDDATPVRG